MPADPIYTSAERLAYFEERLARKRLAIGAFDQVDWEAYNASARVRMAEVDAMPPHWKQVVWEKGLTAARRLRAQDSRPIAALAATIDLSFL